jgi:hypothetical protein
MLLQLLLIVGTLCAHISSFTFDYHHLLYMRNAANLQHKNDFGRSTLLQAARRAGDEKDDTTTDDTINSRRQLLSRVTSTSSTLALLISSGIVVSPVMAAIDVRGLRVEGSSTSNNPSIQAQLQTYDGSATTRLQQIQATAATSSSTSTSSPSAARPATPFLVSPGVATWALRATEPSLQKLKFGTLNRYQGRVVSAKGPSAPALSVSFEYPSDWLQLDKANGSIQFVDQRNGDKLYVLRFTPLNKGSLTSLSKKDIVAVIFNIQGSLVQSGTTVEDARASKDQVVASTCPSAAPCAAQQRRLTVKYATVTGNGLRVERRGLVNAYQLTEDDDVYLLMTSSNAVQFEKAGLERDTVDAIADSFRID